MPERERRHFHRAVHDALATLSLDADTWPCAIEDVSLNGCLLRFAEEWPVDPARTYRLDIHLSYAVRIEMDVQLAHQEGIRAGFRCESIDLDNIAKLRRLVELNLGDSRLLDRDMQALVSIRDA